MDIFLRIFLFVFLFSEKADSGMKEESKIEGECATSSKIGENVSQFLNQLLNKDPSELKSEKNEAINFFFKNSNQQIAKMDLDSSLWNSEKRVKCFKMIEEVSGLYLESKSEEKKDQVFQFI